MMWLLDGISELAAKWRQLERKIPIYRQLATGPWIFRIIGYLIPVLIVIAAAAFIRNGYERITLATARIAQVDETLKSDRPAKESRYCRRVFGSNVEYGSCFIAEKVGYEQFARAWASGREIGTLRDHLITCFLGGRREEGTAWAAAASCAEADVGSPELSQPAVR